QRGPRGCALACFGPAGPMPTGALKGEAALPQLPSRDHQCRPCHSTARQSAPQNRNIGLWLRGCLDRVAPIAGKARPNGVKAAAHEPDEISHQDVTGANYNSRFIRTWVWTEWRADRGAYNRFPIAVLAETE